MWKFQKVNPKQSFPKLEEKILSFWKENSTFEKSVSSRENCDDFYFYDGPPFATWLPHYGHILAGTIKDVIPRYQTMKWKRVERIFWWDCHGLPIENIIEKKLEISWKNDIEKKYWIDKFNEACRENVLEFTEEWKKVVDRMWRWVDMDNPYKTMDKEYMESIWWVYKTLYDKKLVYEGNRVVAYCTRCSTPLSNFEVNQWYADKQDKSVTVKLQVSWYDNKHKYFLAWTTTPWTLVANLWLAVWEFIEYVEVKDNRTDEHYILAKERVSSYYRNENEYEVIKNYVGSDFVWMKYEPLFRDFVDAEKLQKWQFLWDNAFTVIPGHHVTTDSWTWIVHLAPAYGEDDYTIWQKYNIWIVAHIDDVWNTTGLLENNWMYVFDYNDKVLRILKDKWDVILISSINHSYPFCWRCDTPLIYRAISAWYVRVESMRDRLLKNNEKVRWLPANIKYWRFWKWLENARDWNVSRNRYWWAVIPVWQNKSKTKEVCIWSIEELYQLNKGFWDITKLVLLRHFESEWSVKKEIDCKWIYDLTEKWKKDAEAIVTELAKEKIDVIYSSPFDRCIHSVEPFAKKKWIEIITDDRIVHPDLWDNHWKTKWSIPRKFSDEKMWGTWESTIDCFNRWKALIDEIVNKHPWKTVLICSHWMQLCLIKKSMDEFDFDNVKTREKKYIKYGNLQKHYLYSKTWKSIDLHRHFVDDIKLTHPETKEELKRVSQVLDCWFESWAMPYAHKHYPFENKDTFSFPADFIAEGLDQTRGWFYTLLILGTALFENTPFLNVIVNGIVLAEDGKKMSKRLQNYPEPGIIMNKYGADAMRFYLMNSSVAKSEDLRFTERWVDEVVKKVILPLWNTFYFFTTYANIDNFKPESWNIYFVRHWETDYNVKWIMNWWDEDSFLTENGIKQAHDLGKYIKASWIKFDVILSSPLSRAKDTATIVSSYLDNSIEIIEDEWLREQLSWEFKWMSHDDIKKKYRLSTTYDIRKAYRHCKTEPLEKFEERVLKTYEKIKKKYAWKNVLIASHTWVLRPINKVINNLDPEDAYYKLSTIKNWKLFKIPNYEKKNLLDKWITSELNKLISEVRKWYDTYDLQEAAKPVVKFLDNLTNWYIRRSRKRFWKSENDGDKMEAYNTLYDVLVELTKVMAPMTPFITDHMYKALTWWESVHLDVFPESIEGFIFDDINKEMARTQSIVNLWLSWRANRKIRVRQPLQSITIAEELDEYYQQIIQEELNVKKVNILTDSWSIATKICKPNARLIWPKYGKDVQQIIQLWKAWKFEELEDGKVQVWAFILEANEYEIAYEKSSDTLEIEAGYWIVIAMDPEISKSLKLEGYARDIVRHIQEARKEANYDVDDRITVSISWDETESVLNQFAKYIEWETLSTIKQSISKPDIKKELDVEGLSLEIQLKK